MAVTIVLGLFGILLLLIFFRFIDQIDQLLSLIPASIDQLQQLLYELQTRIPDNVLVNVSGLVDLTRQFESSVDWAITSIYQFFSNSLILTLNLLFVFVLTLMLLANPQQYRQGLVHLFPAFYRHHADEILSKCEVKLVSYVAGIALSMSFVGITSIIGLMTLQVPLPVVNGLLAGLSAFIPYVGAIVSAIPPILLALIDAPWKAVAVIFLYFTIQQVEGNFVTPIIMKQQVNLLPATTLALLTAFGTVFGFLGLLLGLPILIVMQTWLEEAVVHDILDTWKKH